MDKDALGSELPELPGMPRANINALISRPSSPPPAPSSTPLGGGFESVPFVGDRGMLRGILLPYSGDVFPMSMKGPRSCVRECRRLQIFPHNLPVVRLPETGRDYVLLDEINEIVPIGEGFIGRHSLHFFVGDKQIWVVGWVSKAKFMRAFGESRSRR